MQKRKRSAKETDYDALETPTEASKNGRKRKAGSREKSGLESDDFAVLRDVNRGAIGPGNAAGLLSSAAKSASHICRENCAMSQRTPAGALLLFFGRFHDDR